MLGRPPDEINYGLDEKDYLFVQEYVANGFNRAPAAQAVYNCSSYNSASVKAHKLLKKDKIKQAVKLEVECIGRTFDISESNVLRELSILAFSDINDFVEYADDQVSLKSSEKIGTNSRAIKEFTITPVRLIDSEGESFTGSKVNIKLHDKLKPLEMIGKHMLMFNTDKAEIEINDNKIIIERKVIKSKEDLKDE